MNGCTPMTPPVGQKIRVAYTLAPLNLVLLFLCFHLFSLPVGQDSLKLWQIGIPTQVSCSLKGCVDLWVDDRHALILIVSCHCGQSCSTNTDSSRYYFLAGCRNFQRLGIWLEVWLCVYAKAEVLIPIESLISMSKHYVLAPSLVRYLCDRVCELANGDNQDAQVNMHMKIICWCSYIRSEASALLSIHTYYAVPQLTYQL